MWAAVNIAACAVLAVMSYVSSVYILDWLESLDRRLSMPRKSSRHPESKTQDEAGGRADR